MPFASIWTRRPHLYLDRILLNVSTGMTWGGHVRNWPYPAHLGTSHLRRTRSSISTRFAGMIRAVVAPAFKATSINSEKRFVLTFFIKIALYQFCHNLLFLAPLILLPETNDPGQTDEGDTRTP